MKKECIGGTVRLPDGSSVPLSKAIRAGGFVFVSGQLPFGSDGKIVSGGIAEQTRQCLENTRALLESFDATLDDIVRATIWLTDTADFPAFNAVYAEFFPDAPPARSTVCSALMLPDAKIEIEVTVHQPKGLSELVTHLAPLV